MVREANLQRYVTAKTSLIAQFGRTVWSHSLVLVWSHKQIDSI